MMLASKHLWLGLILFPFVLSGCNKSGPKIAPVHGQVTVDGRPLKFVDVSFQPDDSQRPSMGQTDADGRYELGYKRGQPGAIVGSHTVRISISAENVRNPPIIAKEFDTQTTLRREVEPHDNEFDFKVTTEK